MSLRKVADWGTARLEGLSVPLMAAAMAKAMPVLPEVASIRVSPGLMRPFSSACLIMLMAGLQREGAVRRGIIKQLMSQRMPAGTEDRLELYRHLPRRT